MNESKRSMQNVSPKSSQYSQGSVRRIGRFNTNSRFESSYDDSLSGSHYTNTSIHRIKSKLALSTSMN